MNENVEKPSLEAFGMTILAVMSYQTTHWEELAKKPSIRKTLKYIAIRGNSHYDEMEALTKELIRKHFDGITQKMVLGFLKIIRGVSNEERPTTLVEYTPFAAQYYAIHHGLHQLIRGEHPDDAAVIIHCAIEDGILFPTIPRSLLVDEFNLKKSSFDKYFRKYHLNLEYESDAVKKQVEEKIKYHRRSLRNAIGYNVTNENKVHFYDRKLGRKNFLSIIIALDILAQNALGFNGAEIEECVKEAMFTAYVESQESHIAPKLQMIHLIDAIKSTVPLSKTMERQITDLRKWAISRAKNASSDPNMEDKKVMPVLLTRPELELERSFDINADNNRCL